LAKTIRQSWAAEQAWRSREGAEVFEGQPLPFAELAGDGVFTKTVKSVATAMGLNLRPVLQAQTFSLLISAVESGTAAAFIPGVGEIASRGTIRSRVGGRNAGAEPQPQPRLEK